MKFWTQLPLLCHGDDIIKGSERGFVVELKMLVMERRDVGEFGGEVAKALRLTL